MRGAQRSDAAWLAWITVGVAMECRSPLSKHIRRWMRHTPQRTGHRLLEMVFLAATAWFCAHILHEHEEPT